MNNRKKCLFFICLLFASKSLFSVTKTPISGIESGTKVSGTGTTFSGTLAVEPVKVKELDDSKEAVAIIESNVTNAEVYLNGSYMGRTTCTIDDVKPGRYKLELKKTNYEVSQATIEIKAGYELTYNIQMVEICGEIEFKNVPSDALVYVDNSRVSTSIVEIAAKTHTVTIKRFGYKDFKQEVTVPAYKRVSVTPKFEVAPFSLTDFRVSRKSINPDYSSGIGKVKISFSVTNKETARLAIYGPDGSLTNLYDFPEFSTWEQSYTWNGKSDEGEVLEDGTYEIELTCAGSVYRETVKLNRNLVFPLLNQSTTGLGYGRLPALEPLGMKFCNISLLFTPKFVQEKFNSLSIEFGANGAFSEHIMAGVNASAYTVANEKATFVINGNIQYVDSYDITSSIKGLVGGQLRYGYAKNPVDRKGVDYGAGLGGVLMAGLSTDNYSVTAVGQVVMGCVTGKLSEKETLISGGFALAGKPFRVTNFYSYGSYNNYNVISAGVGVNAMPFGSLVVFSLGANTDVFLTDNTFAFSARLGLAFVF